MHAISYLLQHIEGTPQWYGRWDTFRAGVTKTIAQVHAHLRNAVAAVARVIVNHFGHFDTLGPFPVEVSEGATTACQL
jgi:hypothetical protein